MIADMICGPAIIVMASGRMAVFKTPHLFTARGTRSAEAWFGAAARWR
jgi:hypothetical protein